MTDEDREHDCSSLKDTVATIFEADEECLHIVVAVGAATAGS